jgi:hypothetical protein
MTNKPTSHGMSAEEFIDWTKNNDHFRVSPKKVRGPKKSTSLWKDGFEIGVKTALRDNDTAIKLGLAMLEILDRRYEPKKEDY